MSLWALFWSFCQFGLLCFGGGYMLVPLLVADFVERRPILTLDEFGNLLSVAQVTPGPVGINTATYVGYLQGNFIGAAVATLGLILPTIVLGMIAVKSLNRWKETFWVRGILKGVRLAALAMIVYAVTIFLGMSVFTGAIPWERVMHWAIGRGWRPPTGFGFSVSGSLICAFSVLLMLKSKLSVTVILLLSAAGGALLAFC